MKTTIQSTRMQGGKRVGKQDVTRESILQTNHIMTLKGMGETGAEL